MNEAQRAFDERLKAVGAAAQGRWTELLLGLGVNKRILNRSNQACPLSGCGGTDRFRYTDKFGMGNYICSVCGPGGGFKLLQGLFGWDHRTVLEKLERQLWLGLPAAPRVVRSPSAAYLRARMMQAWSAARPIRRGDPVDRYLCARGLHLANFPDSLRYHSALDYYEKGDDDRMHLLGTYPAMLAAATLRGQLVAVHRTYLGEGAKAAVPQAKKLFVAQPDGAAVWLNAPARRVAVAEGIESAVAVSLRHGIPVAAALSAGGLAKFITPDDVQELWIFGDNDTPSTFAGQMAAYTLAQRSRYAACGRRLKVEVFIPAESGDDPLDDYLRSRAALAHTESQLSRAHA